MHWRTLVGERNAKFLVKGTELGVALCGENSRFALYEVRCYVNDPAAPNGLAADRRYRVRDAATVSDVDVKRGIRPAIVGEFDTLAEAEAFVLKQRSK